MASNKRPKDILKKYDKGYVQENLRNIKVDDNRVKKWTTLINPVDVVQVRTPLEIRINKLVTYIRNNEDNIQRYKERMPFVEQQLKTVHENLLLTRLKYEKYSRLVNDKHREMLTKLKSMLTIEQNKNKPNQTRLDKIQNNINKLQHAFATIDGIASQLRHLRAEYNQFKRDKKRLSKYNPEVLTSRITKYKQQLDELRHTPDTEKITKSPYYEHEINKVEAEYKKYGLRFFASKEDMKREFLRHDKDYWKTHSLEKFWQQYLHRDELLASGQYEEYKAQQYRDNYIKALLRTGSRDVDIRSIVANLNNLNSQQLADLFRARKGKVTEDDGYALPAIGFVYAILGMHSTPSRIEESLIEQVKTAFASVGLRFDDNLISEEVSFYQDQAKKRYKGRAKTIEFEDFVDTLEVIDILKQDAVRESSEYHSNIDKAASFAYSRLLSYEERVKYAPSEIDTLTKRRIIVNAMNKIGLRFNRFGEAYVPFFKKSLVNELIGELITDKKKK